nr:hypothetical protein KS05_32480 [Rhizobium brockwellii]
MCEVVELLMQFVYQGEMRQDHAENRQCYRFHPSAVVTYEMQHVNLFKMRASWRVPEGGGPSLSEPPDMKR